MRLCCLLAAVPGLVNIVLIDAYVEEVGSKNRQEGEKIRSKVQNYGVTPVLVSKKTHSKLEK